MQSESAGPKAKKKVLIVDDEKGFSEALQVNLELTDKYVVLCENDSSRAVEIAREFSPDIMLLDIVMPGMDGGDVAIQFKDDPELNSIPIVWLTALLSQDSSSGEVVTNEEGQRMIAKPASLEQICRCIDDSVAE